jgi:hypothetical protein
LRHHRNHGPISVFFNHVASASSLRGIRPPHVSIRAIVVDASLRVSSGSYLGQRRHRHRIPPLDRRAASAPGHLLLFHPRMGAVGHMGRRAASAAGLLILVCPPNGSPTSSPRLHGPLSPTDGKTAPERDRIRQIPWIRRRTMRGT